MGNPHIDPPKTSSQTELGASLSINNGNGPPTNKKPPPVKIGSSTYNSVDEALKTYNKYQDTQATTPGVISTGAHTIKYEKGTAPGSKVMNANFQQYGKNLTYTGESGAVSSDELKKRSIEHLGDGNVEIGAISNYIAGHPSIGSVYSKRYEDENDQTYHSQQYGFKPHEKFDDANLSSETKSVAVERQAQANKGFKRKAQTTNRLRQGFQSKLKKLGIETFGNRRFEYEGNTTREQKKNYRADKRDDIKGFGDKAKHEDKTTYYVRGKEKNLTEKEFGLKKNANEYKKAKYNTSLKKINDDRISFGKAAYPLAK
tara:strand:+ start:99 stop:1043 length:945 start_codon:yes stop_codon:yes gene_type:complete